MAKKKTEQMQPIAKPFKNSPFASLKGLKKELPEPLSVIKKELPRLIPQPQDENSLFCEAMHGVKPLGLSESKTTKKVERQESKKSLHTLEFVPPKEESALFIGEISRLKLDRKFTDSLPQESELRVLSGNRLNMLKRGVIKVERQLDLHGLYRDEALQELSRFIRNAQAKGEKAVLVITGKGLNSEHGPVLQQAVVSWLRDAGKQIVLEFAPAPREMGGSGALVVFLRKQKQVTHLNKEKENNL